MSLKLALFPIKADVSTSEESSSCGCSAARDSNSVTSRNPIEPARGTQQYSDVALLTTDNTENKNMNLILGGVGYIGTDLPIILRDGEGPRRAVNLSSFLLDIDEVTNNDFKRFVETTGYQTEAEQFGWSFVFYTALPETVLEEISTAVLGAEWWLPVNGSYWLYPEGPRGGSKGVLANAKTGTAFGGAVNEESSLLAGTDVFSTGRGDHAVVQVSWRDAQQYCAWRGARLLTEAEWEYAAQGPRLNQAPGRASGGGGGVKVTEEVRAQSTITPVAAASGLEVEVEARYPWGDKLLPGGRHRANTFQGSFPGRNTAKDGFEFIAPGDAFPPQNEYGLRNMIGNVWEWVSDWHTTRHATDAGTNTAADAGAGRVPLNPQGPAEGTEKVKKGGSFLCHKSYCFRYRTAARYPSAPDSGTYNIGFRCARSVAEPMKVAADADEESGGQCTNDDSQECTNNL